MKKVLYILKKLTSKKGKVENICELEDRSKEVLDLNVLVNNSLIF